MFDVYEIYENKSYFYIVATSEEEALTILNSNWHWVRSLSHDTLLSFKKGKYKDKTLTVGSYLKEFPYHHKVGFFNPKNSMGTVKLTENEVSLNG